MNDPERMGRILSWLIVLASIAALAVMFMNRAHPPARDPAPLDYNPVTHEVQP